MMMNRKDWYLSNQSGNDDNSNVPLQLCKIYLSKYKELDNKGKLEFKTYLNTVVSELTPSCKIPKVGTTSYNNIQGIALFFSMVAKSGLIFNDSYRSLNIKQHFNDCIDESAIMRSSRSDRNETFRSTYGGEASLNFSSNANLQKELEDKLGFEVINSGHNSYLYYDKECSSINMHVDRKEYEINVLVKLSHTFKNGQRSKLILWDSNLGPIENEIPIGNVLAFHANGTIHGRLECADDEKITLLSMGFVPKQIDL